MGILLFLFAFLTNRLFAIKFVDRNHTHQLFEYTFSETECENGLFHAHEFESGMSFGPLTTGQAIRCIGRSGYHSVPLTTSYSFESNGTFAPMIDRLMQTKEFSIECWIKVEEQSFILSQFLSVAGVTSTVYDNKDLFSFQQYADNLLFLLQTGTTPTSISIYNVGQPYVHLVITVKMRQSGTDLTVAFSPLSSPDLRQRNAPSESNGCSHLLRSLVENLSIVRIPCSERRTLHSSLERRSLLHRMVRSRASPLSDSTQLRLLRPALTSLARTQLRSRICEHALPHSHPCPRLQLEFPDQSPSRIRRHSSSPLAAPHRSAFLPYADSHLLSSGGRTRPYQLDALLSAAAQHVQYRAVRGSSFPHARFTNLTVVLSSPYGTSSVKTLRIFVEWMNHPPVVHNAHHAFTTAEQYLTTLRIDDEDGDKDYTRIIDVSSHCRVVDLPANNTIHAFGFRVEYLGGSREQSSDSCTIRLVVGDTHGAESREAVITYNITNALLPASSFVFVEQGIPSPVDVQMQYRGSWIEKDSVRLEVLSVPFHGIVSGVVSSTVNGTVNDTAIAKSDGMHALAITSNTTTPILYTSQPLYFSDPSTDINGNDLGMENDTLLLACIHRSLRSPPFPITLIIRHRNSAPTSPFFLSLSNRLYAPNTVWFTPFETTALTNILINDTDRDTQLARLRLQTSTSYINVNASQSDPHNPVRWVGGNVGQGMDDTLVELEGSISAFAAIVNKVTFRGIYRMNDTLVVTLIDGPFNVSAAITLAYLPRETTATTPRFWILVILIAALLVIWLFSLCIRACSLCRCRREKTIPVGMRPSISPPVRVNQNVKQNAVHSIHEMKQIPEQRESHPPKKTPPPLPLSLPPAISKTDDTIRSPKKRPPPLPTTEPPCSSQYTAHRSEMVGRTPDDVEVISRRTVKPPSHG